jgi:hypothetical protein
VVRESIVLHRMRIRQLLFRRNIAYRVPKRSYERIDATIFAIGLRVQCRVVWPGWRVYAVRAQFLLHRWNESCAVSRGKHQCSRIHLLVAMHRDSQLQSRHVRNKRTVHAVRSKLLLPWRCRAIRLSEWNHERTNGSDFVVGLRLQSRLVWIEWPMHAMRSKLLLRWWDKSHRLSERKHERTNGSDLIYRVHLQRWLVRPERPMHAVRKGFFLSWRHQSCAMWGKLGNHYRRANDSE